MANEAGSQEITINIKGPSELKLQIAISTDKTVLELKQLIAEKSNVEAERQRLIYSGRVLKDEDHLSTYKIQSAHTIHMVKGVSRSGGPRAPSAPQPLPTMQAGQNPHDPLTLLNSHLGFGAMAGVNPFSELGLNQNDPNMFQTMMSSPQFFQQMSTLLADPAVLDQVIASNPQLASLGPQVRAAFQNPQFREMISNPERLQQMMQMASTLRQAGFSPTSGLYGAPLAMPPLPFQAPGLPSSNPAQTPQNPSVPSTTPGSTPSPAATGTTPNPNAAANQGGAGARLPGAGGIDPALMQQLMAMGPFGAGGFGAAPNPSAASNQGGAGARLPGAGAIDPAFMQQLMAMGPFGGAGGFGSGGLGGFGGSPTPPADTRAPEERFQAQLQQLRDMGFTNASQNIRALLATGGNVQSAIEYILDGGGL
ncbi:hypothetical protein AX14_004606 [Amanita brunnescens Koide BX004]|nr:hypothetical protein AX14_004606 [Amanita brunnescens Koide BX004]